MLNDLKTLATDFLNLSRDALHIHLGLAIYVIAILVFRRGPTSVLPWLSVLAFELINEALDLFHEVDFSGAIVSISARPTPCSGRPSLWSWRGCIFAIGGHTRTVNGRCADYCDRCAWDSRTRSGHVLLI